EEILACFDGDPTGATGGGAHTESAALAVTIPASPASAPGRVGPVHAYRLLAAGLEARGLHVPIVLSFDATGAGEDTLLAPSLVLGSLLCDGIGDAVRVRAADAATDRALAFNILQGARVRTSKTEFISCPSCGRTLFDLEETTRRIKEKTAHLKGLKI